MTTYDPTLSQRPEIQEALRLARAFKDHIEKHDLTGGTFDGVGLRKPRLNCDHARWKSFNESGLRCPDCSALIREIRS